MIPHTTKRWLGTFVKCFESGERMRRGLILRWTLWGDGEASMAIPGYAAAPPPAPGTDHPEGWTPEAFATLYAELTA